MIEKEKSTTQTTTIMQHLRLHEGQSVKVIVKTRKILGIKHRMRINTDFLILGTDWVREKKDFVLIRVFRAKIKEAA